MENFKNKLVKTKDKVSGEIKDKVGQVTGNETLELKGKIQSAKSDIKEKIDVESFEKEVDEIKENVAEKINDLIKGEWNNLNNNS